MDRPGLPDTLGRALRDLRISVTDRCNFRCTYCMPKEIFGKDYAFLPQDQVLTFEEIERLARVFVGARRREAPDHRRRAARPARPAALIASWRPSAARWRRGRPDAHHQRIGLARARRPLADAGLKRVTVSLDSLDDAIFGAMNGIDFPVARVLDGIDAAHRGGVRAGQGQHGRPPRRQRIEHRADGRLGPRDRA